MTAQRLELEGIGQRKTPEKPTARTGRLQRSNFCEKSGAERSSAWGEAELPSTPWRRADSGSRRIRPGPTSRSALRCGWRSHRWAQPSVPVPPAPSWFPRHYLGSSIGGISPHHEGFFRDEERTAAIQNSRFRISSQQEVFSRLADRGGNGIRGNTLTILLHGEG